MPSLIGKALAVRNFAPPVPAGGGLVSLPGLAGGPRDAESFIRAYGTVGTIFSIVSLYASSVARVPWGMYRTQDVDKNRYTVRDEGSDQREQVFKHQALSVLSRPMQVRAQGGKLRTVRTGQWLMEISQMYLDLTGESYWVIERDARSTIPLGLWPVRPDRMQPVPDADTWIKGYVYSSPDGRQRIPLMPEEVVSCLYPNPFDMYHGLGPVQSVLVDIDAAKYSAEWNRNFFVNSATPGGVIQVDHSLDDDEWNDLTNRWREAHRGVSRAHRVAVLEAGQTWVPNQHTMRDMDFGNLRGVMRDVMREAFRMPKIMLGVSDDVNRANAQTGQEVFAAWGIEPRLARWRDVLTGPFLELFGSAADGLELDYASPMPANREEDRLELAAKAQAALSLVQAGYDPAAVLKAVGLPDMGVAERAVQAPALPPSWVPEPPAAPAEPAAGADDMAALLRRAVSLQPSGRQMAAFNMAGAA